MRRSSDAMNQSQPFAMIRRKGEGEVSNTNNSTGRNHTDKQEYV